MSKDYVIYKATNKINGKNYIGFTGNIAGRKAGHKSGKGSCRKFSNAIKKYGWENFEWSIIFRHENREFVRLIAEPFFIWYFDSIENGYNLTFGGEGTFGLKKTDAERKKLADRARRAFTGKRWYTNGFSDVFAENPPSDKWRIGRTNQKPTNKGTKLYHNSRGEFRFFSSPPESGWTLGGPPMDDKRKMLMSESRKGKKHSEERCQEARQNFREFGPSRTFEVITPEGTFSSCKEAARHFGISPATFSYRLKMYPTEYYRTGEMLKPYSKNKKVRNLK